MRHLHQNPRPVSGVGFAAAGAPVVEVQQDCQCLLDNFVGFVTLHVYNKSDSASIVLELRIVQALLLWQSVVVHFDGPLKVVKRFRSRVEDGMPISSIMYYRKFGSKTPSFNEVEDGFTQTQ